MKNIYIVETNFTPEQMTNIHSLANESVAMINDNTEYEDLLIGLKLRELKEGTKL
jgi:hypothetical protein